MYLFHYIVVFRCFHSAFLTPNFGMSIHRLLVLYLQDVLKAQPITLEVLYCALQGHYSILNKPKLIMYTRRTFRLFPLILGNRNPVQNKSSGEGPINRVRNAYIRARFATSSSSREPSPSDDDDMDGEVEILGFKLPTEEKVRKR